MQFSDSVEFFRTSDKADLRTRSDMPGDRGDAVSLSVGNFLPLTTVYAISMIDNSWKCTVKVSGMTLWLYRESVRELRALRDRKGLCLDTYSGDGDSLCGIRRRRGLLGRRAGRLCHHGSGFGEIRPQGRLFLGHAPPRRFPIPTRRVFLERRFPNPVRTTIHP